MADNKSSSESGLSSTIILDSTEDSSLSAVPGSTSQSCDNIDSNSTDDQNENPIEGQVKKLLPISYLQDDKIDDAVSFSLCSLGAIRLSNLYPEEYHEPFRTKTLQLMISHFGLPERLINTIMEFTMDDEFTFLYSIKQNHRNHGLFKLIEELILMSIQEASYDARSHQLIIEIAELLGVPRDLVELHCENIYDVLLGKNKQQQVVQNETTSDLNKTTISEKETEQDSLEKKSKFSRTFDNVTKKNVKRYMIVGLVSLGGAAVMGVTGGLAAPVVASALAGVVGSSLAISTTTAGVVGSIFGVAGAGLTASKMQRRVGELEEFSFISMNPAMDQTSLTITIAITGWISDDSEAGFMKPWLNLRNTKEQYCVRYEPQYLLELSQAMDYLLSFVFGFAAQQALTYTFLAGVISAIAWPAALLSIANVIDNPWDVCINRAQKAGERLAEVLRSRQQGKRPATLIGFSLGARVIFYCLHELSKHEDTLGMISDVIILGAPVTASEDQWKSIARIVSGKIVNGYSNSDWLLKFLYRTSNAAIKIAGLQEIPCQHKRLRNVNLEPIVGGHMDYYKKIDEILNYVNIKTADPKLEEADAISLNEKKETSSIKDLSLVN